MSGTFKLVFGGAATRVRKTHLRELGLFTEHRELLSKESYDVASDVKDASFEAFVDALQGENVKVTGDNCQDLKILCAEFGFGGLDQAFCDFQTANPAFEPVESLRSEISRLLERVSNQEKEIEQLKLSNSNSALVSAVRALEARVSVIERGQAAEGEKGLAGIVERIKSCESELSREREETHSELSALKSELSALKSELAALKSGERRHKHSSGKSKEPQPVVQAPPNAVQRQVREFTYNRDPFGGIIAALNSECGGTVDEKGIIAVTAKDRSSFSNHEKNVVCLWDTVGYYVSKNEPGAWLCLDFKDRRVNPTHYSIRTFCFGTNSNHLKSWVIEGSLDGSGWSELDRREDNQDLNGGNKAKTFPVSKSGEFRFIRLRPIGKNHAGSDLLICSAIEVFGTLLE